MLEFLCPNGHKIHCPEQQAGRAAKCPRCGVKFVIPDASQAGGFDPSDSGSGPSRPELKDSATAGAPGAGPAAAAGGELLIEFLCPNGHRLHGAASLQGRPGECPECGARFRIPTYEDVPEEEDTESGINLGRADGSGGSSTALPLAERPAWPPERPDAGHTAHPHPLAVLFGRLWAERPPGGSIELHLKGGETILPERYAPALSQHDHAVFAVKEPTGTHMLSVVPWDSIARVQIRGVAELPEEMQN